jgi:hypothetical protein
MEDYFAPGFKAGPFVHMGSQSLKFWQGIREEQMHEGLHLVGAFGQNIGIARDIDPEYIEYWKSLVGESHIINIHGKENGKYLSEVIIEDPSLQNSIKEQLFPNSQLMPFLVTSLEEKVAYALDIPLFGSVQFSQTYGTKSGIRRLAEKQGLLMPPGFVCWTLQEIQEAILALGKIYNCVILKHDSSASGYGSRKLSLYELKRLPEILNSLVYGTFTDRKECIVVEGWIKSSASLCAQIEIQPGKVPVVCAAWQQHMATDEVTYMGAGPLQLSKKALSSFLSQVELLAMTLASMGVVGSFGPDFLISSEFQNSIEPDTCMLVELNARVPVTAFPLELIKHIKGSIGEGFSTLHLSTSKQYTFRQIHSILQKEKLLISEMNSDARGVIPFNVGLLPWKAFNIVAMASTWEEASYIVNKVKALFENEEPVYPILQTVS